jgi:hypothetical protein
MITADDPFKPIGAQAKLSVVNGGADGWTPIMPVPADAPAPPAKHYKSGTPAAVWEYRDAAGRLLHLVARFEEQDGKAIRPLTYCQATDGRRDWRWQGPAAPRPLYGLDRLAARPDPPVLLVEGEKSADAADQLLPDYVAITSSGGCKAASKANWSPLAGRDVVIWPDADESGNAYAVAATAAILAAGARSVATLAPPVDVAGGWDAADAQREGWTGARAAELVASAKIVSGAMANTASSTPENYDWRTGCITAAQLQKMTFPPVNYVIPGVLAEGLSILAGRPKMGKSWLALFICLLVAGCGLSLGGRVPLTGNVLYAALEDNQRRLQRRVDKLLGAFSKSWPERFTLATRWRRLDKGGVDDFASWIGSVETPRLIVVDTLATVKPIRPTSGYTEDYSALEGLHRLANEKQVAVLVLHHTRKQVADDPLDTVSGTLGLTGVADTSLVLFRSGKGTSLYIRGRDIEEAEHAMSFDRETCRWSILGDACEVHRSAERKAILHAIGDDEVPVADIVKALGWARSNVEKLLHSMMEDGDLSRPRRGVYARAISPGKRGKNGKK